MAESPEKPRRTDWNAVPVLFILRAACPHCGHDRYDKTRTLDNGDGTSTKLYKCRACGLAYKIVAENPDSGQTVVWPL